MYANVPFYVCQYPMPPFRDRRFDRDIFRLKFPPQPKAPAQLPKWKESRKTPKAPRIWHKTVAYHPMTVFTAMPCPLLMPSTASHASP